MTSTVRTGMPRFMMPAFSITISSTVSPRIRVWSRPMEQMTDTVGVTTLVASRRPPSPTSSATASASRKWWKANAVVSSKKVAGSLWAAHRSTIIGRPAITASSEMSSPRIWMRSRKDDT